MNPGYTRVQSSYSQGGSGGGQSVWPTVLKVTGIGCGILLLVGGLLTAFGVFRIATCCSDLQELAETADRAEREAYEFAVALHERDYEAAYELLDLSVRDEMSLDQFGDEFDQWRVYLDASRPFPVIFDIDAEMFDLRTMGDSSRWYAGTWYDWVDPEENVEARLKLYLILDYERDGEIFVKEGIVGWEVEIEEFSLERAEEPHLRAARIFHNSLRNGDLRRAQDFADPGGQLAWIDEAEFEEQVSQLSYELSRSFDTELWAVLPMDQSRLVVRYAIRMENGQEYYVDYIATPAEGKIYDISPMEPADTGMWEYLEDREELEEPEEQRLDEERIEPEDSAQEGEEPSESQDSPSQPLDTEQDSTEEESNARGQ